MSKIVIVILCVNFADQNINGFCIRAAHAAVGNCHFSRFGDQEREQPTMVRGEGDAYVRSPDARDRATWFGVLPESHIPPHPKPARNLELEHSLALFVLCTPHTPRRCPTAAATKGVQNTPLRRKTARFSFFCASSPTVIARLGRRLGARVGALRLVVGWRRRNCTAVATHDGRRDSSFFLCVRVVFNFLKKLYLIVATL